MRFIKIIAGPAIAFAIFLLLNSVQPNVLVSRMGAIAAWMATWWILESVPLAATSLLPVFLYPLAGIMSTKEVSPVYMNDVLFLFVGGFLMAFAMEKWNLHRRIALRIILKIGADASKILLGLMLSCYLLSMWMSNTATVMMMIPTTLAVISRMDALYPTRSRATAIALLLGIAYASSIGGIATLVGTPPNLIFLTHYTAVFPERDTVTFLQWFLFGFPLSLAFLVICYFLLKKMYIGSTNESAIGALTLFRNEYSELGKMKYEEKVVLALFSFMALLWFTRADLTIGNFYLPGWSGLFSNSNFFQDGTVAVLVASLLFVIPSKQNKDQMLLELPSVKRLPFDIILLFGGGFALALGFTSSGLSEWLALQLSFISTLGVIPMIIIVCFFMTFLTEVTSNMATTQLILPILAAIAIGSGIEPLYLMIPATISASFAFMLPVATAPNTIIFSSEKIKVSDMVKTGIWLNLIGVVLTTLAMILLGKHVFNI